MESEYSIKLKQIMALVTQDKPKKEIRDESIKLRDKIYSDWNDTQNVLLILQSLVNQYADDSFK